MNARHSRASRPCTSAGPRQVGYVAEPGTGLLILSRLQRPARVFETIEGGTTRREVLDD